MSPDSEQDRWKGSFHLSRSGPAEQTLHGSIAHIGSLGATLVDSLAASASRPGPLRDACPWVGNTRGEGQLDPASTNPAQ